mmetsp:Transcript_46/g.65  ORF Transcript_46/g.65 Transcript_46/m.65 type:complete len:690 (+) Transcript_46:1-2070(+)
MISIFFELSITLQLAMYASWLEKANQFARQTDAAIKERAADIKSKFESGEIQEKANEAILKAKEETQKRLSEVREKYESGELEQQARGTWQKVLEEVDKSKPLLDRFGQSILGNFPEEGQNQIPTQVEFTFLTERIIAMPLPGRGGHTIEAVSEKLNQMYGDRFMVYNISEEKYDYSVFNDQVLEFNFPGHPAPPLGLLFRICSSIESWLDADTKNVAVVHCLTGKGRTATVLACLMAWLCEINNPMEALHFIAEAKCLPIEKLTIPSQKRYIQYFSNMLDGVRPRSEPLLVRRCIMNTIPKFSSRSGAQIRNGQDVSEYPTELGCCPYLQLFKGGHLIFTTTWKQPTDKKQAQGQVGVPKEFGSQGDGTITLPWAGGSDGSVAFPVDTVVQGDILIRCRHLTESGSRVSMFRAAFHTGYISSGVLRLTKSHLDGACNDSRFEDDFFVDIIFAPVEKEEERSPGKPENAQNAEKESLGEGGIKIKASEANSFDAMLHKDKDMWEQIAQRKTLRESKLKKVSSAHEASSALPFQKFSIAGDSLDIDDEEEIDFSPSSASASKKVTEDLPPPPVYNNSDLLQQLAAAELDTPEESSELKADAVDVNDLSSSPVQATPLPPSNVSQELSALEELEKELGLEGINLAPDLSDVTGNVEGKKNSFDDLSLDDDLEGLEDYLQTLTSSSKDVADS